MKRPYNRVKKFDYSVAKIGDKYNLLTIVSEPFLYKRNQLFVYCQCECGSNVKPIELYILLHGKTKSCGCLFHGGKTRKCSLAENGQKTCGNCKITQSISCFSKVSNTKDKLNSMCRTCRKFWDIKHTYNISKEEYFHFLDKNNYCCCICGVHESKLATNNQLVIDHCHKTNKFRGILCKMCNVTLGGFHDSIPMLEKAIIYLKENNPK